MKITNKQVLEAVDGLNELTELKLPVKAAFKLTKITKDLQKVIDSYNEVLKKLQEEHVQRDEEGNQIMLDDPENPNVKRLVFSDRDAFNKAYAELLEIENEVNFSPIPVEELGDVEISSAALFKTDWLFTLD